MSTHSIDPRRGGGGGVVVAGTRYPTHMAGGWSRALRHQRIHPHPPNSIKITEPLTPQTRLYVNDYNAWGFRIAFLVIVVL